MTTEEKIQALTQAAVEGNLDAWDELKKITMIQNERKRCLEMHKAPITRAKDGRWRTRIGGRHVYKTRRADLEDAIVEFYSQQLKRRTFPEVFDEWIKEREEFDEVRKSSLTRYRTDFKRFFPADDPICSVSLENLTDSDLEKYIKRTIKRCKLSRKTYGGLVILVQGVLRHAKREKYTGFSVSAFFGDLRLPDNLFRKPEPQTDHEDVFTPEETELLVKQFEKHPSLRSYGLRLMLMSGLRVGELSALRKSCVHLKDLIIDVQASEFQYNDETGHRTVGVEDVAKTDEGRRRIFLPDGAGALLKKILLMSPPGEWVFAYDDGRRIRSKAFNDELLRACDRAEIPRRSTHKLRKTYASALIDSNVNAKLVQGQMGHRDFQTTKKYYDRDRTSDEYKRAEINRAISNM